MDRIRLALIDDHALFRESLARLFASEPDIEVVAQWASAAEVLAAIGETAVDVLLLDFNLGADSGMVLIETVRKAGYRGKILLVTAAMDGEESMRALQLGASGIFLKHNSPASLTMAIHMVAAGEVWLDRRIVQLLAERVPAAEGEGFGAPLTEREEQVLKGVLEGSSNRRIAEGLGGSEGAVKAAIQQLFRKAGVRTRAQLVRVALEGRVGTERK